MIWGCIGSPQLIGSFEGVPASQAAEEAGKADPLAGRRDCVATCAKASPFLQLGMHA
jgi:hypothetical protein